MTLDDQLRDLAIANRILARQGVVDALGHVSIRHPDRPDRFLLSRSRSPELVVVADMMEYTLEGVPLVDNGWLQYAERFIHAGVYEARADVNAVIHNHSEEVIPFSVTPVKLKPVAHVGATIGGDVPVWDIRHKFGDTNMLVVTMEQGRDLAATLGPNAVALMRGHGAVVAGGSLKEAVASAIYLQINAKLQTAAMHMSPNVEYLTSGEIRLMRDALRRDVAVNRTWEYWSSRADCTGIS